MVNSEVFGFVDGLFVFEAVVYLLTWANSSVAAQFPVSNENTSAAQVLLQGF